MAAQPSRQAAKGARTACVILAAGKGSRMHHALPKPLVPLQGKPMVAWVLETVEQLGLLTIVVEGPNHDISSSIDTGARFIVQPQPAGPGDSIWLGVEALPSTVDSLLVLLGDSPLVSAEALRQLSEQHLSSGAALTLLTGLSSDRQPFSHIARDKEGRVAALSLDEAQAEEAEYSLGPMVVDVRVAREVIPGLLAGQDGEKRIEPVVALLANQGRVVETLQVPFVSPALWGINTQAELSVAETFLSSGM